MKNILFIIIAFISFQTGFSQEAPKSFSLQEAIDYALENNRQAKNATRDIEAAKKQKWETTASGLPQIDASVNYQNFLEPQLQGIPADFGNPNSPLIPLFFGAEQTTVASARLSQLLFDGTYIVGLQASKVFLEISKNAKEKTDLEVRKAVINAYGNVLISEESVVILEKNIAVIQKNLNETISIYENGLEEEESVEQLQITLTGLESNLNKSKRLKTIAIQMFNVTLSIPFNENTLLTDSLEDLTLQNINLETLNKTFDATETIDYKIANNTMLSDELRVKAEKAKALPSLSASLSGGLNTFGDDFTVFNNNTQWFDYAVLGVNLSIPIFSSGLRNASTQRAKINLEKSKAELEETEQQLNLQIATAKSNYQFATEDYYNKKQNLALAERIESKNQTKFFEGVSSSFELRQAQTQLYAAQQDLLQAMLDVINTKIELETVTNNTTNF
ncbi:MAG: TolC family protein [Winogradskyella sp.]|uniref:TolC family protein n=1 Tax=Winogradskyella sp. TaxID=1883156 RepID=UPI00385FF5B5